MMAPNEHEMSEATDVRLSEHADRLRQIEERQNIYGRRFDDLGLVIMGSKDLKVRGLVERTESIETVLTDIVQWRRDIAIYIKAGLAILTITGLGTWLPYIQQLLHLWGGIK